jgi:alanine racemase
MDLVTLDATDAPGLAAGDRVELLGPAQGIDALAAAAGTVGYEILTSLGSRYARRYVGATDA